MFIQCFMTSVESGIGDNGENVSNFEEPPLDISESQEEGAKEIDSEGMKIDKTQLACRCCEDSGTKCSGTQPFGFLCSK